jgi:hypothetical protein
MKSSVNSRSLSLHTVAKDRNTSGKARNARSCKDKILHVVVDNKFIDCAIREFEAVEPGIHEYIIVGSFPPYRYVKSPKIRSCRRSLIRREMSREDVKAVFFHYLDASRYDLLDIIPASKKVFWIGWGADYYDVLLHKVYPDGLILPDTAKLCRPSLLERAYVAGRGVGTYLHRTLGAARLRDPACLERVDYFSPVLDQEIRLAWEQNTWFRAQYVPWNYCTVEDDLTLPETAQLAPGNNVLLGNSATPTNNHVELFRIIADHLDLTGRNLIVPLGYGQINYRHRVIKLGQEMFGDAFVPLTRFLPFLDYASILASCNIVMMNHIRQQALGNICISGLIGAKLFLNRRSPLFHWLQGRGILVNDIEAADFSPVTRAQREANAAAIRAQWGRDVQRAKTRRLLDLALA